jgi:hypothetical protein
MLSEPIFVASSKCCATAPNNENSWNLPDLLAHRSFGIYSVSSPSDVLTNVFRCQIDQSLRCLWLLWSVSVDNQLSLRFSDLM